MALGSAVYLLAWRSVLGAIGHHAAQGPATWYWKCGASHRSVPASGLTWLDERHPGCRVSLLIPAPPIWQQVQGAVFEGAGLVGGLVVSSAPLSRSSGSPLLGPSFPDQRGRRWLQPPCTDLAPADLAGASGRDLIPARRTDRSIRGNSRSSIGTQARHFPSWQTRIQAQTRVPGTGPPDRNPGFPPERQ